MCLVGWLKEGLFYCRKIKATVILQVIIEVVCHYGHLDQQKLLPEEQKGCWKRSRETNDLIYIDRAVIREVKSRKKNLAVAWIDYKKAYDMVPHSWIKECLDLFGVAENIKNLLVNSLDKWRVMLCAGNSKLGVVVIKQGIFFKEILYLF